MIGVPTLRHEFVERVPEHLDDGTLYISVEFAIAVHKCCCGCGSEVVTPLAPTDWKLTFDGESISLYPSVGNWSSACRSHYWIERSRVYWAESWSDHRIDAGRRMDRARKDRYFHSPEGPMEAGPQCNDAQEQSLVAAPSRNWWSRFWRLLVRD